MTWRTRFLFLTLFLALALPGCSNDAGNGDTNTEGQPDSGTPLPDALGDVVADPDALPADGTGDGTTGYDLYLFDTDVQEVEALTLYSLDPGKGKTVGNEQVVLTGTGFADGMKVFFSSQEAPQVYVLSGKKATVYTPAGFPGLVDVEVINPDGAKVKLEDGFLYYSPVKILSVEPAAGPTTGGVPIVVNGSGFAGHPSLIVGDKIAIDVQAMDDSTLLAVTPPGTAGYANISVSSDEGLATMLDGFFYYEYPELQGISPAAGSAAGGSLVQITMLGAHEEAEVYFGEEPAVSVTFVDYHKLEVVTPPATVGFVDVSVTTPFGSDTRPDGFFYYGGSLPPFDLQIISVQPAKGPTSGGNEVQIASFGLTNPDDTTVLFGNKVAPVQEVIPGLMLLSVLAPAAPAGAVDVTVMNSNGSDVKAGGYTYLPMATIYDVAPDHGPPQGGTQVVLSGAGFEAGAEVSFGALPAAEVTVVDPATITARTPMGSPGPVDVLVKQSGTTATLAQGFTYDGPLDLFVVEPNFGSIAGGTLITLVGSGFTADEAQVTVAGIPCSHVTVHSYNKITAKTPPGVPGTFDVELFLGGESTLLPLAFTYFDPVSFYGGTWGGEIYHSVNVTVLDGTTGAPLPDAFVMLWADPDTPYQGYTDINGMVTFSGPDLMGEQMVTASKECYSNSSVVEYNATNTTLYLSYNCPSMGGGMPPGSVPPEINGRVTGLGKYVVIPPGNCNYSGTDHPFLCQACASDMDCGGPENACINLGDQGKKCLTGCETEADCPLGFSCTSIQGGSEFGHCLPLGGKKMIFCATSKGHFLGQNSSNGPGMFADGEGYFNLVVEYPPPEVAVVCLGGVLPLCSSDFDCTFADSVCYENGCWMGDGRPEMTPYAMGVKRHVSLADMDGDGIVVVNDVLIELDVPMNRKVTVFFDEPHLSWEGPNAIFSQAFVNFGADGVFEFIEFPVKFYWDDDTTLTFNHLPNSLTGSLANTTFAIFGAAVTAGENAAALPKTYALLTDLLDFENDAMMVKSENGWEKQASGVKQNLYDLWGYGWTDIYGVGLDGTIAHFNGYAWQTQQSPVSTTLRGVHGADGQLWAVGDTGTVVRFNGSTWQEQPYPKNNNLQAVWASAETFVVVAGEYVIDLFDGTQWTSMPGTTGHRFHGLWGVNSQNIWAVGDYGKVVRYANGLWVNQASPVSATLRSVWGTSTNDVWAAGDGGTVIHWDGSQWSQMEVPTLLTINAVFGFSDNEVYFVGNKGLILHYDGTDFLVETSTANDQDLLALHGGADEGLLLASGNHQVVLGPFVTPVTIAYPEEGAAIDQKYLQWQAAAGGPDASFHQVLLQQPSMMGPVLFWDFMADGDVNYVDLPDFPNIEGTPGVPAGYYIYTVQRVVKEGFDIDNFDFTDLDYRTWRTWSQVQQTFVSE